MRIFTLANMKSSKKKGLGRGLTALFGDQIKDEKKKKEYLTKL